MGMAEVKRVEHDYPYQGLADRVHVTTRGHQWNTGLSFLLPVCELCGALLADQMVHDEWHESVADKDAALGGTDE